MSREELSDVFRYAFGSLTANMHTCLPGQILLYDPILKKASVKPLIQKKLTSGAYLTLPVITEVPVHHPSSATTLIHVPLNPGDGCILLFSERSMAEFLTLGGDSTPIDVRRFSLNDAICIPGLNSFASPGIVPDGNFFEIIHGLMSMKVNAAGDLTIKNGASTFTLGVDNSISITNSANASSISINGATGTTTINGNLDVLI